MNPKFWPILPSKKDPKWLKISLNRVYVTKSLFTRHLFPFFPKNIIRGGGRTATYTANSQVLTQLKMATLGRVAKILKTFANISSTIVYCPRVRNPGGQRAGPVARPGRRTGWFLRIEFTNFDLSLLRI